MKDPLENISHDFKKDMSECPHCRYNTCRHECEECLKSELSLLRSKVERYEKALDKAACAVADMSTSKDFDRGNLKQYLDNTYKDLKAALSDVGSEGEKA